MHIYVIRSGREASNKQPSTQSLESLMSFKVFEPNSNVATHNRFGRNVSRGIWKNKYL